MQSSRGRTRSLLPAARRRRSSPPLAINFNILDCLSGDTLHVRDRVGQNPGWLRLGPRPRWQLVCRADRYHQLRPRGHLVEWRPGAAEQNPFFSVDNTPSTCGFNDTRTRVGHTVRTARSTSALPLSATWLPAVARASSAWYCEPGLHTNIAYLVVTGNTVSLLPPTNDLHLRHGRSRGGSAVEDGRGGEHAPERRFAHPHRRRLHQRHHPGEQLRPRISGA